MSIQAMATFLPSRLTATAGASMGQPATPLSEAFARVGAVNDLPPSRDLAIQMTRLLDAAPSRHAMTGFPEPSSARPGAQHSQIAAAIFRFFPGRPSTIFAT